MLTPKPLSGSPSVRLSLEQPPQSEKVTEPKVGRVASVGWLEGVAWYMGASTIHSMTFPVKIALPTSGIRKLVHFPVVKLLNMHVP